MQELTVGMRVIAHWTGDHRIGYVTGNVFSGTVRGTSYVPVRFVDNGRTVPDVDVRILEASPLEHVNYPHEPGRLYDCPACDAACHCRPGETECVYEGEHNGTAAA